MRILIIFGCICFLMFSIISTGYSANEEKETQAHSSEYLILWETSPTVYGTTKGAFSGREVALTSSASNRLFKEVPAEEIEKLLQSLGDAFFSLDMKKAEVDQVELHLTVDIKGNLAIASMNVESGLKIILKRKE